MPMKLIYLLHTFDFSSIADLEFHFREFQAMATLNEWKPIHTLTNELEIFSLKCFFLAFKI